jgi:MFS family permease
MSATHPDPAPAGGTAPKPRAPSPFAPFRERAFLVLWLATVLSNVGTWMHDVAAGWLMTSLAPSPLMVAMVQAATTLPIFLFALPAGALADIVDRRKLLIGVQLLLAVVALALGIVVYQGFATPWLLLAFTFALGTGAALTAPAWQSIVPRLVPRPMLQPAVAMNSVGINISRAIGPALAGFIIVALGIAAPFLINAASYLLVVAALIWWRPRSGPQRTLPPEHLLGAIRAGLRYARASGPLRATLCRAVAFFVFASAFWALLPLIVRETLEAGPELYGILLACVGAGAVGGALALPALRAKIGPDRLTMAGTVGMAAVLVVAAVVREPVAVAAASLLAGASWIAVLTSLNVSAQIALPDWVRARGLSIFVMVFFGSMSVGSLIWGQMANVFGIPTALLVAATGALAMVPLTIRWKLHRGEALDLAPSMHWPAPIVADELDGDRGPVMVTVEYRIDPAHAEAFVAVMDELSRERRRDGAYEWQLFADASDSGRWLEYFLVASWLEHLRQHERVTVADRDLQNRVRAIHIGDTPPVVSHLIAPQRIRLARDGVS